MSKQKTEPTLIFLKGQTACWECGQPLYEEEGAFVLETLRNDVENELIVYCSEECFHIAEG